MHRHLDRNRLLLAALAAGFALAATGAGLAAAAPSPANSEESGTLTVWTYYVTGGQIDGLEAQNELFAEAYPDVTVEHVQIPFDQLAPRLIAGAATGDGPDVVFDNVVVDFPALAASGALADLTPYWEEYADAEQFPESAVWSTDEGIFNVMSYTNLLAMFYNGDALDEYGIDAPTTIEELEAAMATVADAGQYTPLAMSGVASPEGAWMFMPLLLSQDVNYCELDSDATAAALGQLQGWAESGYIPTETATWDQADAWQAFASGDFAFGFNGNWNLGEVDGLDFAVGTVQYPSNGDSGSVVYPGGEGIGIGAFSDNPDLAWEYIETAWMSHEAGLINFAASGQIPTRADLAETAEVQENELVQPFVAAAGTTANWPGSPNTAAMQNAMGQAVSGVIAGSLSADDAASRVTSDIADEIADNGSC